MPHKFDMEKVAYKNMYMLKVQNKEVECKLSETEVTDKILSVTAKAFVISTVTNKEEVKFSGKTLFNVVFSHEGEVNSSECGGEFTFKVEDENIAKGDKVFIYCQTQKAQVKTNGGLRVLVALLTFKIFVEKTNYFNYMSFSEELVIKGKEIDFSRCLGRFKGLYNFEEGMQAEFAVGQIVSHSASCFVQKATPQNGMLTLSCSVLISLLLLQKEKNNDIIKLEKVFPLDIELENSISSENLVASVDCFTKNLRIDVTVNEEKNTTDFLLNVPIEMHTTLFESAPINIVQDCYSTDYELKIEKTKYKLPVVIEERVFEKKLSCECSCDGDLVEGCSILAVNKSEFTLSSCQLSQEDLKIEGAITANVLYKNADGVVLQSQVTCPYEGEFTIDFCDDVEISPCIFEDAVQYKKDGLNFSCNLLLKVKCLQNKEYEVISSLEDDKPREVNDNAISIYFARDGQTLWDIAKLTCCCPEDILTFNKDVNFPLEGENKILIYRKN